MAISGQQLLDDVAICITLASVYEWTGIEPVIADIASDYLYAISWGVPPIIIYVALRHTLEGLGQTRPPMLIAGSVLPLNGFLNYALVYGEFGFPEMGGVGCGWATAIVFWVQLLLMLLLLPKPYFKAPVCLRYLSFQYSVPAEISSNLASR